MSKGNFLFTSESVTEGHPDKIADQISDAILDDIISKDPKARVACETLVTTGLTLVSGEITADCYSDIPRIVRNTVEEIGYNDAKTGFDFETCAVLTTIDEQSADIAMGVDREGAGDQGMMLGYACIGTPELMPMPIMLAHKLTRQLAEARKSGVLSFLRPDGKSQVSVEYVDWMPAKVHGVVIAAQHDPDISNKELEEGIMEEVIKRVIPENLLTKDTRYFINATGRFVIGGPHGDTGLTGRKIIVDTYGGAAGHGGGCFSGKDPTKVDRSASYAARHAAKNIVAAGLAYKCEIQLAYVIGVAEPVSIMVNTFNTGKVDDSRLVELVRKHFNLTPLGIIERLKLRRPIYKNTAAYGHFGREEDGFTWELKDFVEALKNDV